MTGTARAWIGVNIVAVGGVAALADRALGDPTSLADTTLTTAVVTLSMAPMMQYLLKARGIAPERWWALVGLITASTVALRALEQRYFNTSMTSAAIWVTVALMVVGPFVAWRLRRL